MISVILLCVFLYYSFHLLINYYMFRTQQRQNYLVREYLKYHFHHSMLLNKIFLGANDFAEEIVFFIDKKETCVCVCCQIFLLCYTERC